jgi:hypothetical protein
LIVSKHFSRKDRLNLGRPVAPDCEAALFIVPPKPAQTLDPKWPERLWRWIDRRVSGEGRVLPKRQPGIDVLEPRLLLSADPLTAAFAVTADAALRISDVEYTTDEANKKKAKELRVQLVQGIDPSGTTVLAERRIRVIDDTKRVVTVDESFNLQSFIDDINISMASGTASNKNTLVIDQSVMSLAEGLEINVTGAAHSEIVGPEASAGLVWSLDTINASGATGELSIMAPAGDQSDPDANDTTLDNRVVVNNRLGGTRDHFLTFSGVDDFEMRADRDIVTDRFGTNGSKSEWKMTWDDDGTKLERFSSANNAGSLAGARATDLTITGAEGFKSMAPGHLNLSAQTGGLSSGGVLGGGATINADAGELRLFKGDDFLRLDPLIMDVRGITEYTGTQYDDAARAARGVSMALLGGDDKLTGNDDLLNWNVTQRSTSGDPEASLTLSFNELQGDGSGTWVTSGASGDYTGIDEIKGSDAADRLHLNYGRNVTVKVLGETTSVTPGVTLGSRTLEITSSPGAGNALIAKSFEEIYAQTAGIVGQANTLDYSLQSADITIDASKGEATGLSRISGFTAFVTGTGADQVVADGATTLIDTRAGDDTITLAVVNTGSSLDVIAGTGADELVGEEAGRSASDLPVGTYFRVNTLDGNGAVGVATTQLNDGTGVGGSVSFSGIASVKGSGTADDRDTLDVRTTAAASWYVSDVFHGTVVSGGGTLTYDGIYVGRAINSSNLTLSYSGDSGAIKEYVKYVITDLGYTGPSKNVTGLYSFEGSVTTLIGTQYYDTLIGDASTVSVQGLGGDDQLGMRGVAGRTIDGGGGTDTLYFDRVTQDATVLNSSLVHGDETAFLVSIEGAIIMAQDTFASAVAITAADYSAGSVILRGGAGDDTLTGSTRLDDTFASSGGSDTIISGNVAPSPVGGVVQPVPAGDIYVGFDIAGDRTLSGSQASATVVKSTGGTDTLSDIRTIELRGDADANVFNASAITNIDVKLVGGAGDDQLLGGGGDDIISGGLGLDVFAGNGGTDTLLESGFNQYELGAGTLHHGRSLLLDENEANPDTDHKVDLTLAGGASADDSFRLILTQTGMPSLTSSKISFAATDEELASYIGGFRQFPGDVFDFTAVRDGNGLVQSISIEFKMSMGGRDLGIGLNAVSDLSGTLSNQTGVITVGARGGAAESVSGFENVDLTIDDITAGWANVSAYLGSVTLQGSNQSDVFIVGANHRVDMGEGDDFLTVTGAGVFDNTSTYLQGGTGYDV